MCATFHGVGLYTQIAESGENLDFCAPGKGGGAGLGSAGIGGLELNAMRRFGDIPRRACLGGRLRIGRFLVGREARRAELSAHES